ncbi:ATP-binding protein [Deinococcus kurensis]|uniref:ATP-binding protein n=1 Tax=Deinococcus kurensis TaxID=2662757 RepID=UPI0012D335AF|nr:MoxR family ATPase [Deinococcus kurensis]
MSTHTVYSPRETAGILTAALALGDAHLRRFGSPAYMIWGPPGVGKSSVVRQMTNHFRWHLIDVRLSLLAPTDLRGLPIVDRVNITSRWARPGFLPIEEDVLEMIKRGREGCVIFLDEANTAPPQTQAAAYQLVLDRAVGEYVIPKVEFPQGHPKAGQLFPIHVLLAGNRSMDKGVTHQMPAPLLNRMGHIEMGPHVKEWVQHGMTEGLDERVLSFIGYHDSTEKLLRLPSPGERAFPTPRSWEQASLAIQGKKWDLNTRALVASHVGEGAATELAAHVEVVEKLPDLQAVLNDGVIPPDFMRGPDGKAPNLNIALKWSYITALTSRVMNLAREGKLKDKVIDHWMLALGQLEAEYGQLGVVVPLQSQDMKLMQPFLKNAKYKEWNVANQRLLL